MPEFNKKYTGDKLTPIESFQASEEYKKLIKTIRGPELAIYLEQNCQTCEYELDIKEIQMRSSQLPFLKTAVKDMRLPKKFTASNVKIQFQESIGEESPQGDWPFRMCFDTAGRGSVEIRANQLHTEMKMIKNGKDLPIHDVSPSIAVDLLSDMLNQLCLDSGQEPEDMHDYLNDEPSFEEDIIGRLYEIARYEGKYSAKVSTLLIDLDEKTKIYLVISYIETAGPDPDSPCMTGQATTINLIEADQENYSDTLANLEFTFIKYEDLPWEDETIISENSYLFGRLIDCPLKNLNKYAVFSEAESLFEIDYFEEPEYWNKNITIINSAVNQLLN
jgi:hypothetical protein